MDLLEELFRDGYLHVPVLAALNWPNSKRNGLRKNNIVLIWRYIKLFFLRLKVDPYFKISDPFVTFEVYAL